MRAFGTGRSLLVSQVRQDGRERTVFGDRHVFSMSTERAAESDESEHSVADLEGHDVTADRLDSSRKLVPMTVPLGLTGPVKNLEKKGLPDRKPQYVRFTVVA